MPRSIAAFLALFVVALPASGLADANGWAALTKGGAVAILRHAQTVPGIGDPPGFRLDDCATQRNLSDEGRAQARALGEAFRARKVPVDKVLTSAWCRSRDTAVLLELGPVALEPALNSFFGGQGEERAQTAALRRIVSGWKGPGNLVLVTHQVNMTALTGVFPSQGETFVLVPAPDGFQLAGRIAAP